MTTTNDKVRSVLLAAMLVASVFAGTVAFAGAAAAQSGNVQQDDAFELTENSRYWAGQTLFYDGNASIANEDKVELVSISDSTETFQKEFSPDSEGDIKFKTGNLEGSYAIQYTNDTNIVSFDVASQDLSASFDDDSVDNKFDSSTTISLDSARTGYNMTVTSDGLTASDLNDTLSADGTTEDGVYFNGVTADSLSANFNGKDAANYTFTFEVNDTGATAESTINVTAGGDSASSFASDDAITQERGDNATFTVNVTNSKTANVTIGGDSVNWKTNFTVADNNSDGQVTLDFNTFNSDGSTPTDFVSAQGEDKVQVYSKYNQSVYSGSSLSESSLGAPIAAGTYEMQTGVGADAQDVAQLVLSEGSVDAATAWTHPDASTYPEEVSTLLEGVTQSDTTAMKDIAVVQIEASGLYGDLSQRSELNTAGDYNLSFNQTNSGANAAGNSFSGANAEAVLFDAENNTFFAVVDTDANGIEAGQDYQAQFTLNKSSQLTKSEQAVSANFSVEKRTLEFTDLNDEDVLEVANGQTNITGDTNIAAGSEFTVKVQSSQFVRTSTATVSDDGTFSAPFNFSGVENGTSLTVSASSTSASDEVDGTIVESSEGDDNNTTTTTTETTTTEETTTTTTTEDTTTETTTTEDMTTETETTTEETSTTESDEGIPGFGIGVALIAFVAAALLAVRRSN